MIGFQRASRCAICWMIASFYIDMTVLKSRSIVHTQRFLADNANTAVGWRRVAPAAMTIQCCPLMSDTVNLLFQSCNCC